MRVPVQYQLAIAALIFILERLIPTIPGFPKEWWPFVQACLDLLQWLQGSYAAIVGLDGRLLFNKVTIVNPDKPEAPKQ